MEALKEEKAPYMTTPSIIFKLESSSIRRQVVYMTTPHLPLIRLFSMSILIISTFVLSNALVLECEYKVQDFWMASNLYHCANARIIFVGDPNNVTEVTSNHVGTKRNEDVEGLIIAKDQKLSFLPRNINHFFPNLKSFAVRENLVKNIQQSDISVFPELMQLDTYGNKISSLDFDLFQKNPKLQAISFAANPVQHMGYGIFDHLTQLDSMGLQNTCHNIAFERNRARVLIELPNFVQKCPPTIDMFERKILDGEKFEKSVDRQIVEKISPLTKENSQLRQELAQLRQESTQNDDREITVSKIWSFERKKSVYQLGLTGRNVF
ncbi:CLUMA_CG002582, isoform A [Clunio marinus]|uniref:CLUMA_CG002582, isoform A n=1 Tax=Clunio marinus TaxID=568069 RepID=A0A1J1HLF3_9DIPT|nr:CLUMA_CG002582, isoform A [Clunio marinus]